MVNNAEHYQYSRTPCNNNPPPLKPPTPCPPFPRMMQYRFINPCLQIIDYGKHISEVQNITSATEHTVMDHFINKHHFTSVDG